LGDLVRSIGVVHAITFQWLNTGFQYTAYGRYTIIKGEE
jgi:hypothetical protein